MRCFGFNGLFYTALSQSQRKEILSKNGAQRNMLTTVSTPAAGAFN